MTKPRLIAASTIAVLVVTLCILALSGLLSQASAAIQLRLGRDVFWNTDLIPDSDNAVNIGSALKRIIGINGKPIEKYEDKPAITVCASSSCDYVTDGTADDVQLQSAINYAGASGRTLYFKGGTYDITNYLELTSNVHIQTDGYSTVLRRNASSNINYVMRGKNISGFTIDPITIDGNRTSYNTANVDFYLGYSSTTTIPDASSTVSNFTLLGIRFLNSGLMPIMIQNANNFKIDYIEMHSNQILTKWDGFHVSFSHNFFIDKVLAYTGDDGVVVNDCQDATINNVTRINGATGDALVIGPLGLTKNINVHNIDNHDQSGYGGALGFRSGGGTNQATNYFYNLNFDNVSAYNTSYVVSMTGSDNLQNSTSSYQGINIGNISGNHLSRAALLLDGQYNVNGLNINNISAQDSPLAAGVQIYGGINVNINNFNFNNLYRGVHIGLDNDFVPKYSNLKFSNGFINNSLDQGFLVDTGTASNTMSISNTKIENSTNSGIVFLNNSTSTLDVIDSYVNNNIGWGLIVPSATNNVSLINSSFSGNSSSNYNYSPKISFNTDNNVYGKDLNFGDTNNTARSLIFNRNGNKVGGIGTLNSQFTLWGGSSYSTTNNISILSGPYVGIANTSPTHTLDLNGDVNFNGGDMSFGDSTDTARSIKFIRNGSTIGGLGTQNGLFTLWGGSSYSNLNNITFKSGPLIGIGTTTPSSMLTIGATSSQQLLINSLGVITKGTWNGTSLTNDYIASSSFWKGYSDFSASAPISFNNSTGLFAIPKSSSTQDGYLSAADWSNFNNRVSSQWITSGSNIYYSSGKIGIETTTPSYGVDIVDNTGLAIGDDALRRKTFVASITSPYDLLKITSYGKSGSWRGGINLDVSYNGGSSLTGLTVRANTDGTSASVGVGTSTPVVPLQVTAVSSNATTTVEIGKSGQSKGSCLKMYNTAGTVVYCSVTGTTFSCSATSCQ